MNYTLISIRDGDSYDRCCVNNSNTIVIPSSSIIQIINKLTKHIDCNDPDLNAIINNMTSSNPQDIQFNWECASYIDTNNNRFICEEDTIELIKIILYNGYVATFSDFSLKALINCWRDDFGPCPFLYAGNTSKAIDCPIYFDKASLLSSNIMQLVAFANLSTENQALVHCLAQTIYYKVAEVDDAPYEIQVLTRIGRDLAGHVKLTYTTGAVVLVSMCHFSELTQINTNLESIMRVIGNGGYETLATSLKRDLERGFDSTTLQSYAKDIIISTPSTMSRDQENILQDDNVVGSDDPTNAP